MAGGEATVKVGVDISELIVGLRAVARAFDMAADRIEAHGTNAGRRAMNRPDIEKMGRRDSVLEHSDDLRLLEQDEWEAIKGYIAELEAEVERLREALSEIIKGEGPFSRDQYTFAKNVIESMKGLAKQALSPAGGE